MRYHYFRMGGWARNRLRRLSYLLDARRQLKKIRPAIWHYDRAARVNAPMYHNGQLTSWMKGVIAA